MGPVKERERGEMVWMMGTGIERSSVRSKSGSEH